MQESNPSRSEHQTESPTAEQVPHSGVHHGERPVDEFDNTKLREAAERGLVNPVPDTPAELVPESAKKSRRGILIGATATVAGAAIVAGSWLGIKAATDPGAESEVPAPNPNETSLIEESPAPEETTAPIEQELTLEQQIAEKQIPAGLSPEEYATALFERQTEWSNAGANDDLVMRSVDANLSWEEFLPQVVEENATVYAPALFGPNWRDSEELVEYVDAMKRMNLTTLKGFVGTAWNRDERPENLEAYRYWREPADPRLVNEEGDKRHFQIMVMNYDNADQNSIDDGAIEKDNGRIKILMNTTIVDGVEYVAAINEFRI